MNTQDIQTLREAGAKWLRANHALNDADAEDVLQDSLIELVRVTERKTVTDPGGLLGTILDRRVKNKLRANKARAKVEQAGGDLVDLSILADGTLTIREGMFAADFDRAFRALPREQQEAFALYELRGLTEYEAAQVLGIPASTVVSRADLARKALRKEV